MSGLDIAIDEQLAAALRGERGVDPDVLAAPQNSAEVIDRINYHGISGLLWGDRAAKSRWHPTIKTHIRDVALYRTMWELRHREMLQLLLDELAAAKIIAIVLKGTALAYDLYTHPGIRERGDSDLLIDPCDLAAARRILARQGFERLSGDDAGSEDFRLQEVWGRSCGGDMAHHIDLHWHLLNAPALAELFPFAECAQDQIALPRLGPNAWAMDRVRTLIHTCIHRTMNFISPYFVDGQTYYGGDRLIWLNDIRLLVDSFSPAQWETFCHVASSKGVAAECLDGLIASQRFLGTPIPHSVRKSLGAATTTPGPGAYLRSRQLGRAWRDLHAIRGLRRKLSYLRARAFPTRPFIRDKYPRHAGLPLPMLYAWRMVDLIRPRPTQSHER